MSLYSAGARGNTGQLHTVVVGMLSNIQSDSVYHSGLKRAAINGELYDGLVFLLEPPFKDQEKVVVPLLLKYMQIDANFASCAFFALYSVFKGPDTSFITSFLKLTLGEHSEFDKRQCE